MKNKVILDPCCGSRMFWFDKKHKNVIYGDLRSEKHILCDGRALNIAPDMKMDFRYLPFPENTFKLVVFDPPHLKGAGKNGWQAKKYGVLGGDWEKDIREGFKECFRVLDRYGVLIFKWNEHSIKVSEVLKLTKVKPLFGHKTTQNGKTIWLTFMKF